MTANCLACEHHYITGGVMSYNSYLHCREEMLRGPILAWRTKERKRVKPPWWCPKGTEGLRRLEE